MEAALAFIEILKNQRLVMDFVYISASALLIYDFLLMLPREVTYVWQSPRYSYTTVLYIITRYIPIIDVALVLHNQLYPDARVDVCEITWPIAAWLYVFEMVFAECILALRTWAIWARNKKVGILLSTLMVCNLIVQCIYVNKFVKAMKFAPSPYPGYRGCFLTEASRILWVNYATLTIIEASVLAILAVSCFRAHRFGHRNKVLNVIHKDGILFYVYLLCLTAANLGIILRLPLELMTLLSPLEDVLYSVLTSRIILNIRQMSYEGVDYQPTELHSDYPGSETKGTTPHVALDLRSNGDSATVWSRSHTGDVTPADVDVERLGGKLGAATEITDDGDSRIK